MSLTLEVPDDLAAALTEEATRAGMAVPDYALLLLSARRPEPVAPRTGAEVVAYWRAARLFVPRPDLPDSPAEARRRREAAQRRED